MSVLDWYSWFLKKLKFSKFFDQKNDHWRHVAYLDIKSGALINFFTVLEVNRAVLNSQIFFHFREFPPPPPNSNPEEIKMGNEPIRGVYWKSENTPHGFGGLIRYVFRLTVQKCHELKIIWPYCLTHTSYIWAEKLHEPSGLKFKLWIRTPIDGTGCPPLKIRRQKKP